MVGGPIARAAPTAVIAASFVILNARKVEDVLLKFLFYFPNSRRRAAWIGATRKTGSPLGDGDKRRKETENQHCPHQRPFTNKAKAAEDCRTPKASPVPRGFGVRQS